MPPNGIRHTMLQGPWHYCARCGEKTKLRQELKWQRGKLLCDDCFDQYPLIGQIDANTARYLGTIINEPDLMPDPKLSEPTIDVDDVDIQL